MREFALRRSVGPYSAGTRVMIITQDREGICVRPIVGDPDADDYIDVQKDDLVKLRDRVDEIPAENRTRRRLGHQTVWNLLNKGGI